MIYIAGLVEIGSCVPQADCDEDDCKAFKLLVDILFPENTVTVK